MKSNKDEKEFSKAKFAKRSEKKFSDRRGKDVSSAREGGGSTSPCRSRISGNKAYYRIEDNDPNWYSLGQQIVKDAASLSFANFTGSKVDLKTAIGSNYYSHDVYYGAFMLFDVINTIGAGTGATDAATVTARRIYTYIRHANSGAKNYEAPDLFMYFMAWGEAFTTLCQLIRAYGLVNFYPRRNRAIPDTILQMLGFKADEVRAQAADLRYHINMAVKRLNQLCVPSVFAVFARKAWLFTRLFADATHDKANVYGFACKRYGYFDPTGEFGSQILHSPIPNLNNGCASLSDWYLALDTQIDAMLSDDDINTMSGDILKAYDASGCIVLSEVSEDVICTPEFSQEALDQIHNAYILPLGAGHVGNITQNANGVISQDLKLDVRYVGFDTIDANTTPVSSSGAYLDDDIFDLPYDVPTPDDVFIATRLRPALETTVLPKSGDTRFLQLAPVIKECGTEVIIKAEMSYLLAKGNGSILSTVPLHPAIGAWVEVVGTDGLHAMSLSAEELNLMTKFHDRPLRPIWYIYMHEAGSATDKENKFFVSGTEGDLTNFTVLHSETLGKIHRAALLSLFGLENSQVSVK